MEAFRDKLASGVEVNTVAEKVGRQFAEWYVGGKVNR